MATLYVGSTEIYTTLTAAIDAAQNGDTIVLKENISESTLTIDGKDIACSENGYELCFDNSFDGHICSICIKK